MKLLITSFFLLFITTSAKDPEPLILTIKNGQVKGFRGNIFIRKYGTKGAISFTVQGETVVISYKDGKTTVYRLQDGIRLRSY